MNIDKGGKKKTSRKKENRWQIMQKGKGVNDEEEKENDGWRTNLCKTGHCGPDWSEEQLGGGWCRFA